MKEGEKRRYLVFKWLQKNYWSSLLVCLIVFVLGGSVFSYGLPVFTLSDFLSQFFGSSSLRDILFQAVFAILFGLCISLPISVGNARFFLQSLEEESKINDVLFAFNLNRYWNIVLIEFVRLIIPLAIVLLAALFQLLGGWIIFTIIALFALFPYYAYRFSPYILAQHPEMRLREVLKTSSILTSGHRLILLLIDLSFGCLVLVATLFLGIGGLLVAPYYEGIVARYYLECADVHKKRVGKQPELEVGGEVL